VSGGSTVDGGRPTPEGGRSRIPRLVVLAAAAAAAGVVVALRMRRS